MHQEFRAFLNDILEKALLFKDDVTHVVMTRSKGGGIVAGCRSNGTVISIKAQFKDDLDMFHEGEKFCFGSLPYLNSILKSKYMASKGASFAFNFNVQTSSDGKTPSLRNMRVRAGKMDSFYQATDPYLNNIIGGVNAPNVTDWTVMCGIDQAAEREFTEISKIHAMAPKIGGDRDDIFSLGFDGNAILASFGEKGHQSNVELTENAESMMDGRKINALFSIRHFKALLRIVNEAGGGVMTLAPKALKVEFENDLAKYTIMLTAKKIQE